MIQLLIGQLESTQYAPDTKGFQNGKLSETVGWCPCSLLKPQSTYRGRGEIGGVCLAICPLSSSVHHIFVCDSRYKERGFASTPHPHLPWLLLPSWWNVRQKVAIATLCVLCGWNWGKGGLKNSTNESTNSFLPYVSTWISNFFYYFIFFYALLKFFGKKNNGKFG